MELMAKKEERERVILKHALDLFVEKGYHQTPTSEISQRAEIAAGTLFNYFEKKEYIINTLYLQIKEEIFSIFTLVSSQEKHINNILKRSWMEIVSWGVKNFNKILFLIQMDDSPIIAEEVKLKIESKFNEYLSAYEISVKMGFLKKIPPKLGLEIYFHAMLTTICYIVKFESDKKLEDQLEISEKAFNNYLYGARM